MFENINHYLNTKDNILKKHTYTYKIKLLSTYFEACVPSIMFESRIKDNYETNI
jgi:hypothetical protein